MNFGKWLLTFCAWVVGAAVGIASLTLLTSVLRWIGEGHGAEQVIVAEAISFAFPIAGALLLARWVQSPAFSSLALRISSRRLRVSAVALLIALYLATWAFGVPAVTTNLVRRDIESYKRSYTGKDPDWWKQFPYVRSAFGIPSLSRASRRLLRVAVGRIVGRWQLVHLRLVGCRRARVVFILAVDFVTRRLTSRSSGRVGRPRSGFAGSTSWRAAQLQIR